MLCKILIIRCGIFLCDCHSWTFAINASNIGLLILGGYTTNAESTSFNPLSILFKAIGSSGSSSPIKLNEIKVFNSDSEIGFQQVNGQISIEGENECELLNNTTFDNDLAPWDYWGCTATSVNGTATITDIISDSETWKSSLYADNILIEKGESYTLKFKAKANASRTIDVKVGQNEPPFLNYFLEKTNLSTSMQNFSFDWTMEESTDLNTALNFFMAESNNANVYIDDVSLAKADCGSSCTQQGQSCNDNNICTTGETYDANCNCTGGTAIPSCGSCQYTDSLALIAVYEALNGNYWHSSYQWNFMQPMDTWRGITLNENGCVDIIRLRDDGIRGTIAPEIGNLSELTILNLEENGISGIIPSTIGNLTNLKILNLSQNPLTGDIPSTIGNLTNLNGLYLSSIQLTGSIPSTIGNLTQLENLSLGSSDLTGSIPTTIGNLTNLESLSLRGNGLTGSIPSAIGNLTRLKSLSLGSNLTGNIPSTIGNLTQLTHLYLSSNSLNGTIPSSIGNLTMLKTLDLKTNNLSGNIPASIGNLTNLTNLSFQNNQLTNLPSTIGNLTNLTSLPVQNNQLTNLPSTIGNLDNLRTLNVSDNQISGNMPSWLLSMNNLRSLRIQNNQLSGCYASDLTSLCNKLSWYSINTYISDGNNFDAPWEDFCNTRAGDCNPQPTCRETDSTRTYGSF